MLYVAFSYVFVIVICYILLCTCYCCMFYLFMYLLLIFVVFNFSILFPDKETFCIKSTFNRNFQKYLVLHLAVCNFRNTILCKSTYLAVVKVNLHNMMTLHFSQTLFRKFRMLSFLGTNLELVTVIFHNIMVIALNISHGALKF